MTRGELTSDRHCYREVGGVGCRCGGFRDSGEIAVAGAAPVGRRLFSTAVLTLLLVVMGLGLLYAYRSQSPAVTPVGYTQAVQEINSGQLKRVTIVASKATLELQSGDKQQLVLPDRPETFQKVLDDYNAANPSRRVVIEYQADNTALSTSGSIVLSLIPVLLIGGYVLYMFRKARRR
jgi:ATP-dependent Zn protease